MNLIEKYNLKVGDEIACYSADNDENHDGEELVGIIGEINSKHFYVWNNTHDGSRGDIPIGGNYNYSWSVPIEDAIELTVLNRGKQHYPIDVRKLNKILCSKKATKSKLKETVQVV